MSLASRGSDFPKLVLERVLLAQKFPLLQYFERKNQDEIEQKPKDFAEYIVHNQIGVVAVLLCK